MGKSDADKTTFHAMITTAVADLDSIGPKPVGERGPIGRRAHPSAEDWEQKVAAIGRAFFLAAWQEAKTGNLVAEGYVENFVSPATDDSVIDYAVAKIDARWAEAIRAMV